MNTVCQHPGCERATTEGRTFCSTHKRRLTNDNLRRGWRGEQKRQADRVCKYDACACGWVKRTKARQCHHCRRASSAPQF